MKMNCHPGVAAALFSAFLFGTGTPLAKLFLTAVNPWLLAGLLYLGSGIGLALCRLFYQTPAVRLSVKDSLWFAGAIAAGGILAPVLLMFGLTNTPASDASLLLNAEGLFTTLLAWFVFKENFGPKIFLGMLAIVGGAVLLSWPDGAGLASLWPALAILGACLAWGIDNNLTRKVSLADPVWLASCKGLAAGSVNLILACLVGAELPSLPHVAGAMVVGFFAYGVSLVLFILGLRFLGTARTGAYFSVAPFIGAAMAVVLGEPLTVPLVFAGLLMSCGIWLHLTENHTHAHRHTELGHEHEHIHDEHHQHTHDSPVASDTAHTHSHQHPSLEHTHTHFPDSHHQHKH
nr:DMT family transporter [uncultured Anaeromusa sp.]